MGNELRAVPAEAPRAWGLIRVSDEAGRGDDLISPDVQRVKIRDYAAARGYRVTRWVEGIDESGSREKSKWWAKLDEAIAAVEAGQVDVIVVWQFSRTARHRLKWAQALHRLDTIGARLESATEQVDVTTSAGRFTRGMFGEVSVLYAEMIGDGWRNAHAHRVSAGRPHTGKPKWGYIYDRESKLHRPDPVTGPVLADMYRRFVAGESMYSLVHWLNRHGHRTTVGGGWSTSALRRVLDSGFASGRFMSHGQLVDGVHEPVIDETLWQAYLDARAVRRGLPPKIARSRFVLAGLVRCAECRGPMSAGTYGKYQRYRCETRYARGLDLCSMRYVPVELVEGAVLDWLQGLAEEVDVAADSVKITQARRVTAAAEADRLAREAAAVKTALTRLAVQNATTPLPASVYAESAAQLAGQLEQLEAAVEEAAREARTTVKDPPAVARGLLEGWVEWPVEHRREVLRGLLEVVWVASGEQGVSVEPVGHWERR